MKFIRSLLTASCIMIAAGPANASPALARDWSDEAASLQVLVEALNEADMPADLRFRLQRFGRTATRLSNAGSDAAPLPQDLGCIFRGMAEETGVQLAAFDSAQTSDERLAAETRLEKMLEDAVSVGEAAALVLEAGEVMEIELTSDLHGQCSAGAIAMPDDLLPR